MATTTSERTTTSALQGLKLPRIEHPALHRSTVEGSSLALKGSRLANNRRGQYCSLPCIGYRATARMSVALNTVFQATVFKAESNVYSFIHSC